MDTKTTERVTITSTPNSLPAERVQTQTVTSRSSMSDFFVSKTNQIIFSIIGIIDLLIALRIVFLLLGANQVGIVSFIISITQIFVAPFAGIFPSPSADSVYLDVAAVIAIVMYLVLGLILGIIISLFSTKTEEV